MKRRVVITGIGVVSPIGVGKDEFYNGLAEARSGVAEITRFDAASFPTRIAAEVKEEVPLPAWPSDDHRKAIARDPKSRFAVAAADEALNDAFGQTAPQSIYPATAIGVFIAAGLEIFFLEDILPHVQDTKISGDNLLKAALDAPIASQIQIPSHLAAQAIRTKVGAQGPFTTNVSACAAGTQALGDAFLAIQDGVIDMAICGGYDSMINPLGLGGFCMLEALSVANHLKDRASRPFDQERDGFVLGEGSAILVLEEYSKAKARGANIIAEIFGYQSTLDAFRVADPDLDQIGAIKAMQGALARANIRPESIGYINAHGTATRKNDPAEAAAIRKVFGQSYVDIPVSSTKSQIGHLIGAAGAVEFLAGIWALQSGKVPATINLETPDPECELCHVAGCPQEAPVGYFLSNSFGFGGQNACIVAGKTTER
jgi:3-oxoacyl-(acyl-carrier-protein) synthase